MLEGSREREGREVQEDIYVYLPYVYILRISPMMMLISYLSLQKYLKIIHCDLYPGTL